MEQTFFEVMEDVEIIEMCAIVFEPDTNCPIHFSFNIRLHTADGTAGKMYSLYRDIIIHSLCCSSQLKGWTMEHLMWI